jgi:hypothetical protein
MAELEECVEEVVWGSQVFSRRWGADPRDLIGHTPEWYRLAPLNVGRSNSAPICAVLAVHGAWRMPCSGKALEQRVGTPMTVH